MAVVTYPSIGIVFPTSIGIVFPYDKDLSAYACALSLVQKIRTFSIGTMVITNLSHFMIVFSFSLAGISVRSLVVITATSI